MGRSAIEAVLYLAKLFHIVEDFATETNKCLRPIFAYCKEDDFRYIKLHEIVIIIQPRGWAKHHANKRVSDGAQNP